MRITRLLGRGGAILLMAGACTHAVAAQVNVAQTPQPAAASQRREFDVNNFAGFAAAVDALAPAGGMLVVSTPQLLVKDQLVPAGVFLRFERGGQLTASAPVSVTIREPLAAGRWQIFAGGVAARFDGAYPDAFYPEWWGARGDDKTDDLAAFDRMMAALVGASAHVVLAPGRTYFLSDSWQITRPMLVESYGADNWFTPATLRFAPNRRGVVVHGIGTKIGNRSIDDARFSRLRNFYVLGAPGDATGTCDVAGLTVTKLTGEDFTDGAGYHDGNTITINGYEYVIAGPPVSPTQLTLHAPRLVVGATQGSPIVDNGVQLSTWPTDWRGQTINIGGVAYTIAAINPYGGGFNKGRITLTAPFTGETGSYAATITGFTAPRAAMRPNLYHGIELRGEAEVENMQVRSFAGNCISADTSLLPAAYPGTSPNMNVSVLRRNSLYYCKGNGIYTHGVNANQITIANNDATDNNGAGFYEASFLGNLYLGNHASFNAQGAIVSTLNTINFSTFVGEYSESGQPASVFDQYQLVLNGDHGAGIQGGAHGHLLQLGGWTRHNTLETLNSAVKLVGLHAGDAPNMHPATIFGFGAAEDKANLCCGGTLGALRVLPYQLGYDQLQRGWYNLYYGGNYAISQGGSVLAFSGSTAAEGAGKLWLYRGIDFIGPNRDVGLHRSAARTLQVTDGAGGAGNLTAASVSAPSIYSPLKTDAFSAALTLDFAQGNVHTITLTGDVTRLTLTNLVAGGEYIIRVAQDGQGGHSVAWSNVRWAGGAPPRLSAGANRVDIFRFISTDGAVLEEVSRALDVR